MNILVKFVFKNINNPNNAWQQRLSPDCIIIIWTEVYFKEQLPQYLLHSKVLKTGKHSSVESKRTVVSRAVQVSAPSLKELVKGTG